MSSAAMREAVVNIESLRLGVPNPTLIKLLGFKSPMVRSFEALLERLEGGSKSGSEGFILNGGFGTGKSHALETFADIAKQRGFIVSRLTLSKNLGLSDGRHIVTELTNNTTTAQIEGDVVLALVHQAIEKAALEPLRNLRDWVDQEVNADRLAPIFRAITDALSRGRSTTDSVAVLVDYLCGLDSNARDRTAAIREAGGQSGDAREAPVSLRPWQRVRVLDRLFYEFDFPGWLVLIDELELVRLQGVVSRGKSYAELARWFGLDSKIRMTNLGVIGTITSSFVSAQLSGEDRGRWASGDLEEIPPRLRQSTLNAHLAPLAEAGMRFILEQQPNSLTVPSEEQIREVHDRIARQYELAFGVAARRAPVGNVEKGQWARALIRRWILEWDLRRIGRDDDIVMLEVPADVGTWDDEQSP